VISQAAHSGGERNDVAFTVALDDMAEAKGVCEALAGELGAKGILADHSVAKVSIVGAGMIHHPGTAAQMFAALGEAGINIQMISTSEIKVSCVIDRARALDAIAVVHRRFALDKPQQPVVWSR
ncbi:MAG: ACT domain-containing protein, partial [Cyanobacteria bacterium REEB65]|nr:ACT domain-containing protein [Cyanobacteria bacterium REEB65]